MPRALRSLTMPGPGEFRKNRLDFSDLRQQASVLRTVTDNRFIVSLLLSTTVSLQPYWVSKLSEETAVSFNCRQLDLVQDIKSSVCFALECSQWEIPVSASVTGHPDFKERDRQLTDDHLLHIRSNHMTQLKFPSEAEGQTTSSVTGCAMATSYNEQIRPLLDAVDRLRNLKLSTEGIQLPTIVVVGDQSSGKSSVLESLAGITLPRGQGICTRVPLIMRLQNDPDAVEPVIELQHSNTFSLKTTEADVADSINKVTAQIAGDGKGVSDKPITMIVRKHGVPDLTLIDLPGITRVPVQGQPDDIYDQIAAMIKTYIAPKESIILNVLSATVDFPTCESIRMSQLVDRTGQRTLAVVTKADRAPDGLLEKVTLDDVQIGLGYVCVRNRIDDETFDEARAAEEHLFQSHPLLKQINKSMVGIPALAQRLTQIQAGIIAKCLPDIVKQINDRLFSYQKEYDQLPVELTNDADALRTFIEIAKQGCATLEKILVRGEFDHCSGDRRWHGTARIREMFDKFSERLQSHTAPNDDRKFLMEEIEALQEAFGLQLPNFLPRSVFRILFKKKLDAISPIPHGLVTQVWEYIEQLVVQVLEEQSQSFPQVQSLCRQAVQTLLDKVRSRSMSFVKELIEMELCADYTANPNYMEIFKRMMLGQAGLLSTLRDQYQPTVISVSGFGSQDVAHLRGYDADIAGQAFDLKCRVTAYWSCVLLRVSDSLALHVLCNIQRIVQKDLMQEMLDAILRNNMEGAKRMLVQTPAIATKTERLRKSIALLQESKSIVANILIKFPGEIAAHD